MDDPKGILKREDMTTPRSPHDLCAWVDARISELAQTKAGRVYARSSESLPKKLMEEIRPFGLFANQHFNSEDVICFPNLGNENFDGEIRYVDASKPSVCVEVTCAKDGYDERLRLDRLNEDGSVNWLGELRVTGTKAARNQRVDIADEMVSHDSTVDAQLHHLKDALTKKGGKKYGPQHVLVVVVDDFIAFRSEEEKAILRECAASTIAGLSMDFGAIYLLGASGNYLECICGVI